MSPVPFNVVDGCLVGWVGHQVLGGVLKVKKTSNWKSTRGKQIALRGVLVVNSRCLEEVHSRYEYLEEY